MAKILVVDEITDLLAFFSIYLQMEQHDVYTATTEEIFQGKLENFEPDIIMLVTTINGVRGRHLCNQIKALHSHRDIPIILLSTSPKLLLPYTECMSKDVIEMPFELTKVKNTIDKYLINTHSN